MGSITRERKDIAYTIEFDDSVITNNVGTVLGDLTVHKWNTDKLYDGYVKGTYQFRFNITPAQVTQIRTKLLIGMQPTVRIELKYELW